MPIDPAVTRTATSSLSQSCLITPQRRPGSDYARGTVNALELARVPAADDLVRELLVAD